jgi:hypothetical protein
MLGFSVTRSLRAVCPGQIMLLLIDNYDSFTYNLAHFLGELGAETVVHRNDAITVQMRLPFVPTLIVISRSLRSGSRRHHSAAGPRRRLADPVLASARHRRRPGVRRDHGRAATVMAS